MQAGFAVTKTQPLRSRKDWETRLEHADALLVSLEAEIKNYKQSNPYSISKIQHGTELQLVFNLVKTPPTSISSLTSDLIHNIRSSLDNFIYTACELIAQRELTSKEAKAFDFRFFEDANEAAKVAARWTKKFAVLGKSISSLLLNIQPFSVPSSYWDKNWSGVLDDDEIQDQYDILCEMLLRLIELSNVDKHRKLATPWLSPSLFYHSGLNTNADWKISREPLADGQVFATIQLNSSHIIANPNVEVELEFSLEGAHAELMNLSGELEALIYWTRQALKVLEFELALMI